MTGTATAKRKAAAPQPTVPVTPDLFVPAPVPPVKAVCAAPFEPPSEPAVPLSGCTAPAENPAQGYRSEAYSEPEEEAPAPCPMGEGVAAPSPSPMQTDDTFEPPSRIPETPHHAPAAPVPKGAPARKEPPSPPHHNFVQQAGYAPREGYLPPSDFLLRSSRSQPEEHHPQTLREVWRMG